MRTAQILRRLIKPAAFFASLLPFVRLVLSGVRADLGANPIEAVTHETGLWALRFLVITLAITPLRRLTGWHSLISLRRMLGLFAFFYACVHLFSYLLFDRLFHVGEILTDIADRPFITAGMTALALMIPLAVTSTKGWIRRLGRRWQTLHRIVYLSAAAACLHFVWKVKVVVGEPVYCVAVLTVLLGFRLLWRLRLPERPRPARV